MIADPFGAFCGNEVRLAGAPEGPLAGLRFAAKDLFDIAGHVTGAGNPRRKYGQGVNNKRT